MALPLEGMLVLDLSRLAPGPYCTWLLGDLGADVLRVEQPPSRDGSAGRPDLDSPEARERRLAFDILGRNKRSIALNLAHDEGRQVFYQLARKADIIVEGFRPGVVERLGVDYERVRRLNLRVVYCSISGFGQTGPYRLLAGHDINYIALGGALSIIGVPDDPEGRPAIPANLLADFAGGGLMAACSILSALLVRERTGQGQYIDHAMAEGVLGLMATMVSGYLASGNLALAGASLLTGGSPHYNVYRTKEGRWISVGCLEPRFYANLCEALDLPEYIPHQNATGEKREEILQAFRRVFKTKTSAEWMELFLRSDICAMPVHTLDEVLTHPQMLERGVVVELEHATLGSVRQLASPLKLSETPPGFRTFAHSVGQDTDSVLQELGYDDARIQRLHQEGTVA